MLISIIIPNYNKAPFIRETLISLMNQTSQNWEAIVVDDGSTDGSQQIIKKIAENEPRIQFYERSREPKGGSVCRNIGLEQAKGDYLIFFDSDDLMAPNCLKERAEYMEKHATLDFVVFPIGTFYKTIGDNKMVWRPKNDNHLKMFLRHDLPWHTMAPIWKADFIKKKLPFFDETFPRLQDVEFHTRALLVPQAKYKIANQKAPACFYRIDHSRSQQNHLQMLYTMMSGVELYLQKFENLLQNRTLMVQLRGTFLSYLSQVNYYHSQKWIDENEYQKLNLNLDRLAAKSNLFSKKTLLAVKIYNACYQKGCWKIKGFNYLSKFFIINL